jgi:hypothetical protein
LKLRYAIAGMILSLALGALIVLLQSPWLIPMTFLHAAALALVVWYLMLPPRDGAEVTIHAPLSRWKIDGSYDSARKCQKQLEI